MKTTQILPLLALLAAGVASAQGKVRIGFGYQRTWMIDRQASPLKYQSREKTFLLGYENTGAKSRLQAQLSGAFGPFFPTGFAGRRWYSTDYNPDGSPKQDSGLLIGTLYNARLKVGYAREISSGYSVIGKEKFYSKRYLGASLNNQLFYTDNIVRTGWLNASSFNADYLYDITTRARHRFSFKLSIPLFSRNTRLPYHNTVSSSSGEGNVRTVLKQGSRFAWLRNFQNIHADAGYEFAVNSKVGLGFLYSGQWLHYNNEQPVRLFQNNISLIATLK